MRLFATILILFFPSMASATWKTYAGGSCDYYTGCGDWVAVYDAPWRVDEYQLGYCGDHGRYRCQYWDSAGSPCSGDDVWDQPSQSCVDPNAECPSGQLKFQGVCADVGECDTGEQVVLDSGQSLLQACDGAQECDEGFYWHSATQSCYGPDDQGSSSSDSSSSDSSTSDSSSSDGSTSSSGGSTSSGSGGSTSSGSEIDLSEVVSELNEANSTLDDISSDTGSIKDTLDSWDESDTMPTYTDPGVTSFSEANQNFYNRVSSSQLLTSFNNVSNYLDLSGASCQPLTIDLTNTIIGTVVSSDIMCQLFNQYGGILAAAFMAVYVFAAFRIVAGA